ncbi:MULTISPECIES: hypothetical protein [Hyphomicrobium]|nr:MULTISPECIES: hypothetical protein [Hyphomicrobium]
MSKLTDPPDGSDRPPVSYPVMLTLLCAVLVGLATWTIFLVR